MSKNFKDEKQNTRAKKLSARELNRANAGEKASWSKGMSHAIQQFKESQRLPQLSMLLKQKSSALPNPPQAMDLGNFYHL